MRATLTRFLEALKKRRSSDEGFSLIELIVVVAVLGILVAIAIPVFMNIQQQAKDNALATVVSNGATQLSAAIAQGTVPTAAQAGTFFANLTADTDPDGAGPVAAATLAIAYVDATKPLDTFCVTGTGMGADAAKTFNSGPGC